MINPQELFWSLAEYGKDYVSGNDPIPEFNSKMNEAQKRVFDILSPIYDANERARILLRPFTRPLTGSSDATGVITTPPSFHRVLGLKYSYNGRVRPIYYAKENEITESDHIPNRKASVEKGIVYYTYNDDVILLTPKEAISFDMKYLKEPEDALLVYDYSASPESYMQLSVDTIELEWSQDAYGLLLSALLLEYSLITKDQFKTEIASFGFSIDRIND